jgi:hypothetical protein
MSAFIQHVDVLRHATKAHVALVHHTGKDPTKGARGHSSLLGALDSEFEIKRGKVTAAGRSPPPPSATSRTTSSSGSPARSFRWAWARRASR